MSDENKPGEGKKKTPALFARINEDTGKMLIESILPKVLPFIDSAQDKINEFMGENEKTILMFRRNGKTKVLILDNKLGNYRIQNDIENKEDNRFSVEESAISNIFDVREFAEKLLKGDFSL